MAGLVLAVSLAFWGAVIVPMVAAQGDPYSVQAAPIAEGLAKPDPAWFSLYDLRTLGDLPSTLESWTGQLRDRVFAVSPDGRRVAAKCRMDNGTYGLWLPEAQYDGFISDSAFLEFSPDSLSFVFEDKDADPQKPAYWLQIDDTRFGPATAIPEVVWAAGTSKLAFSWEDGTRAFVRRDGRDYPAGAGVAGLWYGAGGKRFAWAWMEKPGRWWMNIDGTAFGPYRDAPYGQFSRDGSRFAFSYRGSQGWRVRADGAAAGGSLDWGNFASVEALGFVEGRLWVSAVRDGRYLLKQESGERAVEGRIVEDSLRPFGKSIAFKVDADSGTVYHIDDLTLTGVGSEDVAFSADGERWALLVRRDSSHPYALLQDNRETPMPNGYPYGDLQLSFDGSHSAQAIGDRRYSVIIDGQVVGDSKAVRSEPRFAPRGSACAWIYQAEEPAWKGDNGLLWVRLVLPGVDGGQPRIADFGPWDGCGIGFQDDGTLAIYGIRPQSPEVQRLLVKPDL